MNLYLVRFTHFDYVRQKKDIYVESPDDDFVNALAEVLKDFKKVENLRVYKLGERLEEYSR